MGLALYREALCLGLTVRVIYICTYVRNIMYLRLICTTSHAPDELKNTT
jgi:hypothetical protein